MKLFAELTVYYAALVVAVLLVHFLYPDVFAFLPIGGAQELIRTNEPDLLKGTVIGATQVRTIGESLGWLMAALLGALLVTLPVSWLPSTVAVQVSVIGMGTVMSIFQFSVLPSMVPSLTSIEPMPPAIEPVKLEPSSPGTTVKVPFWSPIGLLTMVS